MSLNICMDCNFEKKKCQCITEPLIIQEENMLKRIWKKIKSWFWTKD